MIIKLAAIKRDSKFRVQNGSELSNTSPGDESSLCLCGAWFLDCGCCCLRSIPRSDCYSLLRRTRAAVGVIVVTPWRFLFLFMILKKRVHCSPDQETERVIFAAGLGFHLLYNWSLQSNSCRIFCEIFSTHATIKILSRKSAFALSHALRTTFRTA